LTGGRVERDTRLVKLHPGACAALLATLLTALGALPGAAHANAVAAEDLYRRALLDLQKDRIESRRDAVRRLEQATLMAPDSVRYHLALARAYMKMGYLGLARHRYERAAQLDPGLPEAQLGQGQAWRRDYVKYLDRTSLVRALDNFTSAVELSPTMAEAWLGMLPLLVEEHRLTDAMRAAEALRSAEPNRPDALLAVAHVSYRLGQVERADSLFRLALPRLPKVVRDRYLDIAPLSSERDTAIVNHLRPGDKEAFLARFWKENDPDLASSVNEAQLEYWSRVTQAYFLYFNPRRQQWDQRGEVYVRYGPPETAIYNPVGTSLVFRMGNHGMFPMNVLVWSYPGLGMTVPMQDRLLSEYYLPPVSLEHSTDPEPDPDSLARRSSSLATGGGRGVFPMLPPGARPIELQSALARFEGAERPRLLGWLESPGAPQDSLWGEWVVIDSTGAEVARVGHELAPSACDPAERRVGEFDAMLPPGSYLVGLSVRSTSGSDSGGPRRGSFRQRIQVASPGSKLELSDMVVSCGAPDVSALGTVPAVRLAGNPEARVTGRDPLTVYFEIYHLSAGGDGLSRLEFEYTVRSAEKDRRLWIQRLIAPRPSIPDVSAMRREEQTGPLRRQFVTVPVQSLPSGRFRLEIRVRDLNAGTEAARSAEFVHLAAAGG
jgi:GWxTD domain-containing protein